MFSRHKQMKTDRYLMKLMSRYYLNISVANRFTTNMTKLHLPHQMSSSPLCRVLSGNAGFSSRTNHSLSLHPGVQCDFPVLITGYNRVFAWTGTTTTAPQQCKGGNMIVVFFRSFQVNGPVAYVPVPPPCPHPVSLSKPSFMFGKQVWKWTHISIRACCIVLQCEARGF
jgi:hypothetical protein